MASLSRRLDRLYNLLYRLIEKQCQRRIKNTSHFPMLKMLTVFSLFVWNFKKLFLKKCVLIVLNKEEKNQQIFNECRFITEKKNALRLCLTNYNWVLKLNIYFKNTPTHKQTHTYTFFWTNTFFQEIAPQAINK